MTKHLKSKDLQLVAKKNLEKQINRMTTAKLSKEIPAKVLLEIKK